jgi:hypothetical protein
MEIPEDPFEPIPYLYYCDPMDGKDKFGTFVQPSLYVNISSEINIKESMLACHDSQRKWLLYHHKIDEYLLSMKRFAKLRGDEANVDFAEGFRQHLGHGYPSDNILRQTLGDLVICSERSLQNK